MNRSNYRTPILLVTGCFFNLLSLQSHTPKKQTTLTIQEAIEIAYQNKPNLLQYKHAIEEARMRSKQALAGYFPSVAFASGFRQTQGEGEMHNTSTITVNQLIYSFAGPIEQYKRARKETEKVRLAEDKDKKEMRHEVELAFIECWKLQQQRAYFNAFHTSSRETFEKAKTSNKVDLLDKTDWLKSNSDYATALSTIDNYYDTAFVGQKKLEFFMGQAINLGIQRNQKQPEILFIDLVWDTKKQEKPLKSLDLYYKYALKNRDELKIASKTIDIARDDVSIAQRSRLPVISATASAGHLGQSENAIPRPPRYTNSLGISMSWNIFDGTSHFRENEVHATMLKEILNKEHAAQTINFAIQQAFYALNQARMQLKAKNIELSYAHNAHDLAKQKLEIGDISKVEYEIAKSDWEKTYFSWLELKANTAIKERDLYFACGYPEELVA